MALASALIEILRGPTIGNVFMELFLFLGPLWVAVLVGVLVGWSWKPRWANLGRDKVDSSPSSSSSSSKSSPSSSSSMGGFISPQTLNFGAMPVFNSMKVQLPSCISWISDNGAEKETFAPPPPSIVNTDCSTLQMDKDKPLVVAEDDLDHLIKLVEVTDGGLAWNQVMDRSTQNMYYQAWKREPETGPPQYRSRTVFEDANPELVREFFWDDQFRQTAKWDDMLLHSKTLEQCPTTGTMILQWIRKFPFFCSDREYVIGRRIWESGRSYYCVTKGIQYPSLPKQNKPRRVDLYYSSWCIRAVESKRGTGQMTACEVLLFHHEDMGIPWEIAKLGVRQGMWKAVQKVEPGLRAYQKARLDGTPPSQYALISRINTKINADYLRSMENGNDSSVVENQNSSEKPPGRNIPKLLVVGGALVLACSLDRGLLTKAVIFGVARRFARIGRRL